MRVGVAGEKNEVQVAHVARQLLGRILGRHSLDEAQAGALSADDSRIAVLLSARLQELACRRHVKLADEWDPDKREIALHGLIQFCREEYCARRLPRRKYSNAVGREDP